MAQPSASRCRHPPARSRGRASARGRAARPCRGRTRRRASSRAPVEPVDAAEKPDVLIDRQPLVEREALRHVADAALHAFRIAADVDAADVRRARWSASAGRTACGSSWTCRRRCCRESRRSRRARTSNVRSVDGDEIAEPAREMPSTIDGDSLPPTTADARARRRASADAALRPCAWVRSSSACSRATCASRTSVLVATPAAKPLADHAPRLGRRCERRRRPRRWPRGRDSISVTRCRTSTASTASNSASARASPRVAADASATSARAPAAVEQRPARR